MARVRHLHRAPITEALVDLRAALPDDFQVEQLKQLRDRIGTDYPTIEEQRFLTAKLTFQPPRELAPETTASGIRGYSFKSRDGLTIAQFRRDGFTLNRLRPYTSWAELYPEAKKLWRLYAEAAGVQAFTRVATRYINHLTLPAAPGPDFERYLTTPPTAPPGAPPQLTRFLTRVASRDPRNDVQAIVTQATEPALGPGQQTIILDIDVYKEHGYGPDDLALDEIFQVLHATKNDVFFAAITETTAQEHE